MSIGINVEGNVVSKGATKNVTKNLIKLMFAGQASDMEGKTIRHAMSVLSEFTKNEVSRPVSITGCNITTPREDV
jgi:hypothetical protein